MTKEAIWKSITV